MDYQRMKIKNALIIIDGLAELSSTRLKELKKEGKADNDLSVLFFETEKEILYKLKETLS
jgi:hypothetical protein